MIDVVFLLLAYFLLAAEFREPEGAVAASAAPEPERHSAAFELPTRPVRIAVSSFGPGRADYALSTEAPELAHARTAAALRRAASAARGPVFAADQPFIIQADPEALWEHALAAAAAIDAAGYTSVRFEDAP
jgi:biopolymer transport protein ExbD